MIDIIHGDCRTQLLLIKSKSADIAFCDPPYNYGKKYDGYDDDLEPEVYAEVMRLVMNELMRIAKKGVVVYVDGRLSHLFMDILPGAHQIIVVKRAVGVVSGNYVLQYHSIISTVRPIVKCPNVWNNIRLPGEGYYFREKRYDNPGLTSLELTKKVLLYFTEPGDKVIDPFIGTGTTAVACKEMGRDCLGIEQSQKYIDMANLRLAETYQQIAMI